MTSTSSKPSGCIFCAVSSPGAGAQGDPLRDSLVLVHGHTCYVILNLYPYNNGHLMVVPRRHIASLTLATAEELQEMMVFTRDAEAALTEAYRPQGINVGINLGQPAGAGIVDHMHVHLVPRWTGDTNFMSVVGNTRVLPEDMEATATRLRPIFERLLRARTPAHEPRP
ncbi:MAG: HIT domain-containing protein [Vicinamibacterales bacterium]